ncbi:solute carrier family 22 member 4-like [Centroberyx gerrardi]|uniref:solute carrier family 22 member 4-like n=1 Tax=Centroberyx gerrardi TaxID=166262 RepID=UPI003AAD95FB
MLEYEEALSFLGEWGSFQRTIFILLSLSSIPNGYVGMAMVFLADIPPHRCRLPPINSSSSSSNSSSPSFSLELNHSIPLETVKGEVILSRCSRYRQSVDGSFYTNETEGCVDGWVFSSERYSSTIVTEWSLVCDDGWKAPFTVTIFFFGVLFGSFISGIISDRYGRRLIFFLTMAVQTVFSLLQAFVNSWEMFCVLYFIVGMGQIANYCCAFILGSELLTKKARISFAAVGVAFSYALGYTILPLFAFYIRSWRWLLVALSLPGLLYIPLWWYLPESPRWLLSQGRIKEAELIIRAAAKKNGITPPEVIFKQEVTPIKENGPAANQHLYTWLDLYQTSNIRKLTIINICIWIVISMTYYGMSLNTPNMDGDPYINCLVSGATEFLAYSSMWFAICYLPRRLLLPITLLPSGVLLLLIKFIPDDLPIVTLTLVMIGKIAVTGAFGFLYLYTTELFPTVVRNMALGSLSMASRVGSTVSPYIAFIGTYNKFLPYILMAGATIISGLLSLLLPETKDQELPDLIPHVQPLVRLSSLFKRHTDPAGRREVEVEKSPALTEPNHKKPVDSSILSTLSYAKVPASDII